MSSAYSLFSVASLAANAIFSALAYLLRQLSVRSNHESRRIHYRIAGCPDDDVWSYARKHGLGLVSKDNDFRQLSFLRGAPPKVVWLRIGNAPTQAVVDLLGFRKADIESFVRDTDTSLLTIQIERDYP